MDNYLDFKSKIYINDYSVSLTKAGIFLEEAMKSLYFRAYSIILPKINNRDDWLNKIINSSLPETERLQLARIIYGAYEIRNRKKGAHSSLIDPTFLDVTYLDSVCSWILGEFIRLYHIDDEKEIMKIIDKLIERKFPIIFEIEDSVIILKDDLTVADKVLLILYKREECTEDYIVKQLLVQHTNDSHIKKKIREFIKTASIAKKSNGNLILTPKGIKKAENIRIEYYKIDI